MNRLEQTARDLESIFIQKLFQEMRQSNHPQWDITGNSQAAQTYQSLLDAERAKEMSQGAGVGLWRPIVQQLSAKEKNPPADNTRWEDIEKRRLIHEPH